MRGLYFFLSMLTLVSSSTVKVIGLCGHNVTLPCRYDAQSLSVLSICWGGGYVPISKCSNTILSSKDGSVEFRQSTRYQLLGTVTDGDVSLTILNAQYGDAGVYGCRVEIPGWLNDYKVNIQLVMEEATVEKPITEAWPGGAQEILTTVATNAEVGDTTLDTIGIVSTEEQFKVFLEVENIGRMAVVFFFTIITILVFIFRRGFLQKKTLHLNTSAVQNVYESAPMHE